MGKGIGIISHTDIPELQVSAFKVPLTCPVEGSGPEVPYPVSLTHLELDAADSKLLENNLGKRLIT